MFEIPEASRPELWGGGNGDVEVWLGWTGGPVKGGRRSTGEVGPAPQSICGVSNHLRTIRDETTTQGAGRSLVLFAFGRVLSCPSLEI
jgi:hypothetical protein